MDEPPPLEDCSHLFSKPSTPAPKKTQPKKKKKKKGGIRRGFLNDPKPKKSKLLIRNEQKESKKVEGGVHDDVQKAMKAATGDLHKDADFVQSIISDEERMKIMVKPKFQAALKKFQSNPAEALKIYGDDEEIMGVIRWFSGKMGNEMMKRSKSEPEEKPAPLMKEVSKKRVVGPEQMQKWLADPKLRSILSHPEIQMIIQRLQQYPNELPKYRNHPGIQILIQHGIIQST